MEPLECLFIGSATRDVLLQVSTPPESDARIAVRAMTEACGGVAATACAAFARLGGRAGLMTAIGDDAAGAFIRENLEARGLPFLQLRELPGAASPFSAILVEDDGKRMIAHYGGCLQHLTQDMLDWEAIEAAGMIHLGGLPEAFAVELAAALRRRTRAMLSLDGGNYSREGIEAMLPHLDVFIPDKKTVTRTMGLPPADACRYYAAHGARAVCITLGEKGAIALMDGKFYFEEPARGVHVVDTTGAGDNFHGAFLYAVQRGYSLQKTLRFANAFSGRCCEGLGGTASQPDLAETLAGLWKTPPHGERKEPLCHLQP